MPDLPEATMRQKRDNDLAPAGSSALEPAMKDSWLAASATAAAAPFSTGETRAGWRHAASCRAVG